MPNGPTSPAPNPSDQRTTRPRDRLARLVVVGSFLTIFVLVGSLITVAQLGSAEAAQLAEKTFNTILPVLAGWVGTVLAFYFSSQTLEQTSQSLDTMVRRTAGAAAPSKPITETMIPFASIRGLQTIPRGKTESDITIDSLKGLLDPNRPGGPITRIMVVNDQNVFRYLIHIGTLNAFLVKDAERHGPPEPPLTLAHLVSIYPEFLSEVSKLVAFVPASATVADAKAKLDAIARAQDVIVTATGQPSEPVLGWVTNIDLIKTLSAV